MSTAGPEDPRGEELPRVLPGWGSGWALPVLLVVVLGIGTIATLLLPLALLLLLLH